MPPLSDHQSRFAAALLDTGRAMPAGLKSPFRAAPVKRFNVYRNNVYANLTSVLRDRFPVVARLVGEEFFAATARAFVQEHPPGSPVLMRYGGKFPAFLDRFEPAAGLPYLGDVARLEWAWSEAYHAGDADPFDPAALAAFAPEDAERLVLDLHPSLRVVCSQWPVVTIWSANIAEDEPGAIDPGAGGEAALVIRPALDVLVHRLPEGGANFLEALARGRTLGEAAGAGAAAWGDFDFQGNLTALLQCGAVTGVKMAGPIGDGRAEDD